MDKKIWLIIILVIAVIMGGIAYANIPKNGSPQNTTNVAFQNNGTSWKHVVTAFDVTKTDGSKKSVYADLWVKPKGTASVDLSHILGYGNRALPKGTKIQMKTYKDPNVPLSQLPKGITDNKVTTTTDPTQGGQFLVSITSKSSTRKIITNSALIVIKVKIIIIKVIIYGPICLNTGGSVIKIPSHGKGHVIHGNGMNIII